MQRGLDPDTGIYYGRHLIIGQFRDGTNSFVRAMNAPGLRTLADKLESDLRDTEDAVVEAYEKRTSRKDVRQRIHDEVRLAALQVPR